MASDLFFSVVIPTYNRAPFIERTIRSVLKQSFGGYEIIVVDDGSTDNTNEIVSALMLEFPERISYVYQANSERAAARNTGAKHAKGDYILFFDSDDLLYEQHLSVARDSILQYKRPEFLHLRYDVKDHGLRLLREGPSFSAPPNRQLIEGNFLSCNGVLLRKDIALANPFNETRVLSALEDWELWLRLAAKYPLVYINTITSTIINHDERSVLKTDRDQLIMRMETFEDTVMKNQSVLDYYKDSILRFRLSCASYISLHLALTGQYRKEAFRYLVKSIRISPAFIFKKRFFAIIKHLF
ncbi:MAG: glycosyltransferase family 2 protein [Bacteroidia bacterium]